MDDLYTWAVKKAALPFAALLRWFDVTVINGLMVNETAFSTKRLGRLFSRAQNGRLHDYLFIALFVTAGVLGYFIYKGA